MVLKMLPYLKNVVMFANIQKIALTLHQVKAKRVGAMPSQTMTPNVPLQRPHKRKPKGGDAIPSPHRALNVHLLRPQDSVVKIWA